TGLVTPAHDLLVTDVERGRWDGPEVLARLGAVYGRLGVPIHVERDGLGQTLTQFATVQGIPLRALSARRGGDKVETAQVLAALAEQGKFWLPRERTPWLADLERELLEFPYAAHDDQVDALAYAAQRASIPTIFDTDEEERLGDHLGGRPHA